MKVSNGLTVEELKALAEAVNSKRVWKRFQSVVLALKGHSVEAIADVLSCSVRAVYQWIASYNQDGPKGLYEGSHTGRPKNFDDNLWPRLKVRLEAGPLPKDNCCAFVCHDIQRILAEEFDVHVSARTVNRILHRHKFSWLVPRPTHEKTNKEVQEFYKEMVVEQIDSIVDKHPDKKIEVFFEDEARFGTQGTTTRVWAEEGKRAEVVKQNGRTWIYVLILISVVTGMAIMMTTTEKLNVELINKYLQQISESLASNAHAIIIWDGAGFHRGHGLIVPSNISLIELPPYSPQLNPAENFWHYMRSHKWSNRRYKDRKELIEVATTSINDVCATQDIKTITNAPYITARAA